VILVDTSIWIDHLRAHNASLAQLLERGTVLSHPCVIGELALGNLRQRHEVLGLLGSLPRAVTATPEEVLALIERIPLHGLGIGFVDAQLLAATRLTSDAEVWTNDRRLGEVAARLGCAFDGLRR
jgi:predicted nucleic acid-binding protein